MLVSHQPPRFSSSAKKLRPRPSLPHGRREEASGWVCAAHLQRVKKVASSAKEAARAYFARHPSGIGHFSARGDPRSANPGSLRRVCPDGPDGGITWQHLRVRNPDRFYRLVGSSREIVHVGTWQYAHMHFEKYPKVPISLGRLQSVDGGLETMEIVHEKNCQNISATDVRYRRVRHFSERWS